MYLVINKCVTAVKVSNFSGHYFRNRSTLDIGVLGILVYFNIRNTPPKFGTFLLGHPVYLGTDMSQAQWVNFETHSILKNTVKGQLQ